MNYYKNIADKPRLSVRLQTLAYNIHLVKVLTGIAVAVLASSFAVMHGFDANTAFSSIFGDDSMTSGHDINLDDDALAMSVMPEILNKTINDNYRDYMLSYGNNGNEENGNFLAIVDKYQSAVHSESMGYGKWIAEANNDAASWEKIYVTTNERLLKKNGLMRWKIQEDGSLDQRESGNENAALDGDLDNLGSDINAFKKMANSQWPDIRKELDLGNSIAFRAAAIIEKGTAELADGTLILLPSDKRWWTEEGKTPGADYQLYNLGYSDPAWFDEVINFLQDNYNGSTVKYGDKTISKAELIEKYQKLKTDYLKIVRSFITKSLKDGNNPDVFPDWIWLRSSVDMKSLELFDPFNMSSHQGQESLRVFIRLVHYYIGGNHPDDQQIMTDINKIGIKFFNRVGEEFNPHSQNILKKIIAGDRLTIEDLDSVISSNYFDSSLSMILSGIYLKDKTVVSTETKKTIIKKMSGVNKDSFSQANNSKRLLKSNELQRWLDSDKSDFRAGFLQAKRLADEGDFIPAINMYINVIQKMTDPHSKQLVLDSSEYIGNLNLLMRSVEELRVCYILLGRPNDAFGVFEAHKNEHWVWQVALAEMYQQTSPLNVLSNCNEIVAGNPAFTLQDLSSIDFNTTIELLLRISQLNPDLSNKKYNKTQIIDKIKTITEKSFTGKTKDNRIQTLPEYQKQIADEILSNALNIRINAPDFYNQNNDIFNGLIKKHSSLDITTKINLLLKKTIDPTKNINLGLDAQRRNLNPEEKGFVQGLNALLLQLFAYDQAAQKNKNDIKESLLSRATENNFNLIPTYIKQKIKLIEFKANAQLGRVDNGSLASEISFNEELLSSLEKEENPTAEINKQTVYLHALIADQYFYLAKQNKYAKKVSVEESLVFLNKAIENYEHSLQKIYDGLGIFHEDPEGFQQLVRQETLDIIDSWMKTSWEIGTPQALNKIEKLIGNLESKSFNFFSSDVVAKITKIFNRLRSDKSLLDKYSLQVRLNQVERSIKQGMMEENKGEIIQKIVSIIERPALNYYDEGFINMHFITPARQAMTILGKSLVDDSSQSNNNVSQFASNDKLNFAKAYLDFHFDSFNVYRNFDYGIAKIKVTGEKVAQIEKVLDSWNEKTPENFRYSYDNGYIYIGQKLTNPAEIAQLEKWTNEKNIVDKINQQFFIKNKTEFKGDTYEGFNDVAASFSWTKNRKDLAKYYESNPGEFVANIEAALAIFNVNRQEQLQDMQGYNNLIDFIELNLSKLKENYPANSKISALYVQVQTIKVNMKYTQLYDAYASLNKAFKLGQTHGRVKCENEIKRLQAEYIQLVNSTHKVFNRTLQSLYSTNAFEDYWRVVKMACVFEVGIKQINTLAQGDFKFELANVQTLLNQTAKLAGIGPSQRRDKIKMLTFTERDLVDYNFLWANYYLCTNQDQKAAESLALPAKFIDRMGLSYFLDQGDEFPAWFYMAQADIERGLGNKDKAKQLMELVAKFFPQVLAENSYDEIVKNYQRIMKKLI